MTLCEESGHACVKQIRLLTDADPAILFLDGDLVVRGFTRAVRCIYDLGPDDIGRPLPELAHRAQRMPPLPRPELVPHLTSSITDELVTTEGHRYQRWILPAILDQGQPGLVVIFADNWDILNPHEVAERALRVRMADLESLMAHAPIGFAFFDREHRYILINKSLAQMNGLSPEAHLGRSVCEVLPAMAPIADPIIDRVLASRQPVEQEISSHGLRAPGVPRHWLAGFFPVFGEGDEIDIVGTFVIDITDQKLAENALRKASRHKDEFMAMLGHELRNPLAAITSAVQIQRMLPLDDPRAIRTRDVIERQSLHMARMIDDLLDVARIGRGMVRLHKSPVDVAALVREVAEDYRHEICSRQGLQLAIQVGDEPLMVHGDRTRLAQILGNLLDNATKFTSAPGSIIVRATRARQSCIMVEVRDTGAGLCAEELEAMFEPFCQTAAGRSRGSGLGFGLSLVKGLVDLHGGSIAAHSEGPGKGATFVVYLPAMAVADEPP